MPGHAQPTVLCWGTVEGTPIPELIELAAATGFAGDHGHPAMYFAARAAGHSDADLRARLDGRGVVVSIIDPLLAALPGCPAPESVAPSVPGDVRARRDRLLPRSHWPWAHRR